MWEDNRCAAIEFMKSKDGVVVLGKSDGICEKNNNKKLYLHVNLTCPFQC